MLLLYYVIYILYIYYMNIYIYSYIIYNIYIYIYPVKGLDSREKDYLDRTK